MRHVAVAFLRDTFSEILVPFLASYVAFRVLAFSGSSVEQWSFRETLAGVVLREVSMVGLAFLDTGLILERVNFIFGAVA